jgi:hypothetical protein
MDKLKNAWKSWTIHFNMWMGVLLAFIPYGAANIQAMQMYFDHEVYKWLSGILIGGNLLLRFKTDRDLRDK